MIFSSFISNHFNGLTPQQTCFPEFNNEVVTFIRLFTLLYADDTIILSESAQELQQALESVNKYCSLYNLTVNTNKTKIIVFSRGKVMKFPTFHVR